MADAPQLTLDRTDYQYSIDPAEISASPKDQTHELDADRAADFAGTAFPPIRVCAFYRSDASGQICDNAEHVIRYNGVRAELVDGILQENVMARVVRFHKTGGPEVLHIEELEVPPPGKGEIQIRVHALGLNRAESMFRSGQYLEEPKLPARLGYEAAGTIAAIGPGVQGFQIGDAVSTIPSFSLNAVWPVRRTCECAGSMP